MKIYDAIIVGGGPAGLSSALILARCRRSVLIFDVPSCRNIESKAMYGYLSRDGMPPSKFLEICKEQLSNYPNIEFVNERVTALDGQDQNFKVATEHGTYKSRKVILATGVKDEIPKLEGIEKFFGKSVFICPYCDGWEYSNKPIAVYGQGDRGPAFALILHEWTSNITLCSHGRCGGTFEERKRLNELNIRIHEPPILRLEGQGNQLERIVFEDNSHIDVCALFFNTPIHPNAALAKQIGCRLNHREEVIVDSNALTTVPGVYAAGDLSVDIKLVIVAVAEGAKAGYSVNKELLKEERLIKL
jgi:thioredoxin reductase